MTEATETRQDGVLINALTGMGTARDRSQYTQIAPAQLLSEVELDDLYLSSWLCRRVVDVVASEATRSGWDIALGDDTKKARKQSDQLVAAGERLKLRRHVRKALRMARHHGGAVLIMFLDDGVSDPALPVNFRRLKRIKGLYALDRWRIWPSPGWSGIGEPESYQFNTNRDADLKQYGLADTSTITVHGSRVLRFEGEEVPWRWRSQFNWWGASVLQPIWEVFCRYETGQSSAAALLHDFDLFIHKMPGLGAMIAAGNQEAITNRLQINQMARSIYRGLVLDAQEEGAFVSRSAAGIADILTQLVQEVTGASKIPHTKLWGESPSGLGATGRSEDRSFAQDIAEYQEDFLSDPLRKFYETLMRCSEGPFTGEPPEDWLVSFRPTFVLTDDEAADLRQKVAASDSSWINAGVLRPNEVALARFGRPEFSLDTTLIDREEDGSIKQEDQDLSTVEFGGDAAGQQPPGAPAGPQQPGAGPGGPQQQPQGGQAFDSADGPCCESCGRGDPCESDCPACEEEPAPTPPRKRRPPAAPRADALQAMAGQLSIAAPATARRRQGRGRTIREDGRRLPARIAVAGLTIDVGVDGTGPLVGPYGTATPHVAVVGPDPTGLWEVMDGGQWFAVVGVADGSKVVAAAGPDALVRPLETIDLVALGARCDAYEVA